MANQMRLRDLQPSTDFVRKALADLHSAVISQTAQLTRPHRFLILRSYLTRALGWIHTLSKVDDRIEFQVLAASARGLLESAADCLLIHRDTTNACTPTIDVWERSALIKAGDIILKHYSAPRTLPAEFAPLTANAVSPEATFIRQQRQALWNKPKHPNRWANKDLGTIVSDVDSVRFCNICQPTDLEEIYVEQVSSWNLFVHGSGAAGLYMDNDGMDHTCASLLLHSWRLSAMVGLVVAHEIFAGTDHIEAIHAALVAGDPLFKKFIGASQTKYAQL